MHSFQSVRKRRVVLCSVLLLLCFGIVLELLYLALYPLLAETTAGGDSVQQALPGLLPWLPGLYWTRFWPPQFLAHVSWLNLTHSERDFANVLLLLLGLASAVVLFAAAVGRKVTKVRLSSTNERLLFWIVMTLTLVFSLTMLIAPVTTGPMSQDMLLYGLYGRMVVAHHVNPYVFVPTSFPQDILQTIVRAQDVAPYGPVWVDLSIMVALFAHDSVANVLLGFRTTGLLVHLLNAVLLWSILARMMPEKRIAATLLYAWNPLVLLIGISMMHLELVVVLFILLAVLFFQRDSFMLSWMLILLTALINLLCVLLLPLFLRLIMRKMRIWSWRKRLLWWSGTIVLSLSIVALAYAPYWQGWGFPGLVASVRQVFLRNNDPVNSLNAALLYLPAQLPGPIMWLLIPHHWAYLVLILVGCLLLFSLWLADTLELVIFFGSWLFLLLAILGPVYWPWYVILPLMLAFASNSRSTILLVVLLMLGALFSFYCWQGHLVWPGQGLAALGLPLLLWGWTLFFTSLWRRTRPRIPEPAGGQSRRQPPRFSRPAWLSRPSFPSRPGR